MVSSEIRELRSGFKKMTKAIIDVNDYHGELSDLAFDLCTTESFIAGLVGRILENDILSDEELRVLAESFIVDGRFWNGPNEQVTELAKSQSLFEFAIELENVRKLCVECACKK